MSEKEKAGFIGKIAIATNDQKRVTSHIGKLMEKKLLTKNSEKMYLQTTG